MYDSKAVLAHKTYTHTQRKRYYSFLFWLFIRTTVSSYTDPDSICCHRYTTIYTQRIKRKTAYKPSFSHSIYGLLVFCECVAILIDLHFTFNFIRILREIPDLLIIIDWTTLHSNNVCILSHILGEIFIWPDFQWHFVAHIVDSRKNSNKFSGRFCCCCRLGGNVDEASENKKQTITKISTVDIEYDEANR